MWFGVRPTSTDDQWRVFLLEKEGEDYTLKTSLLSLQEKKKQLEMQLKTGGWRFDYGFRKPDVQQRLKERSPFFVGRGSLFIGENPPHMSRGHHPVKALAAAFCDCLALD